MQEKRRLPRKIASELIRIYDINSKQHLGQLVNITVKGFMLTSDQPIDVNLVYQLEMVLTGSHFGTDRVSFGAESLWRSQSGDSNRYWVGFKIIDISVETTNFIRNMTKAWETDV